MGKKLVPVVNQEPGAHESRSPRAQARTPSQQFWNTPDAPAHVGFRVLGPEQSWRKCEESIGRASASERRFISPPRGNLKDFYVKTDMDIM